MEADGIEMVMLLRRYRANTNHPDTNGRTLFRNVVEANGLEKVRLLLKHGAKSDTADVDYVMPLTCADKLNPPHMVKPVIQSGASVVKPDLSGKTPLAYAVIDGYIDVCEELLRVNAEGDRYFVHNSDQQPPLLSRSRDGEQRESSEIPRGIWNNS